MARSFPVFVGLRYSLDRDSSQLVSFLSRLSMLGLILGVALLIVVLSVMNGFDREMRGRILALVPQLTVTPWSQQDEWQVLAERLEQHPGIVATAPFVQLNGMLIRNRSVEPALVYGLDPQYERQVSLIHSYTDIDRLTARSDDGVAAIVGAALARKLGVASGDRLAIAVPRSGASGSNVAFTRLRVVDTVATGTELDQNLLLMHIDATADLGAGAVDIGVRARLADVFAAPRVGWELRNSLERYYAIEDWTQKFGNMYQAIQLSRKLVAIMLLAVVAVAVFNVVSTLVMVVNDKQADIAILRSQGAAPRQILRIFLVYGAVIGVFGVVLGGGLGILLSLAVTDIVAWVERLFQIQFLHSDVYPISYLPADLRWQDVLLVTAVSYLMSLLATLYPAWRASRVPPAEALRYR